MSNIRINLKIEKSNSELTTEILKHMLGDIREYFTKGFDKIKSKLADLVIQAIKNSPEYQSLLNGQLKAEFGLADSSERVNGILDFWKNTYFEISSIVATNGKLKGKFTLNMIKSDFQDVIGLQDAVFTTEKGSTLNWLEWLLLFGDKTIVKDYEVQLGPNPRSRTGLAVMKKTIKGKWGVPSQFSGNINNNWITRSIDSVNSEIENLINSSL